MGPGALAQVLQPLSQRSHERLIVGLQTSDDAAVYRVSTDQAVIQTIDFFTPIVDDPYTYGAIAAANSMSDVYAMGGDVAFALNVVAFPDGLDPSILARILQGGADKVEEAGGVIAGGHTVTDDEPKYGLSVTGFVHPDRIWRKAGAQPGDLLVLTKPIGTGIIATALKNQIAPPDAVEAAVTSMLTLNRAASEAAREAMPNACTDITGFGLLGHGYEVAERSSAKLRLSAAAVPLLPGALAMARAGQKAGGLGRNRDYFAALGVRAAAGLDLDLLDLFYDPQTSGGLLISVPNERVARLRDAFERRGLALWEIGRVEAGSGIDVEE
jgi:selenide,water dikinase